VLHEAETDLIVDFYGGFFAESCVFICMEYVLHLILSSLVYMLILDGRRKFR
jgi:hypothetical protein